MSEKTDCPTTKAFVGNSLRGPRSHDVDGAGAADILWEGMMARMGEYRAKKDMRPELAKRRLDGLILFGTGNPDLLRIFCRLSTRGRRCGFHFPAPPFLPFPTTTTNTPCSSSDTATTTTPPPPSMSAEAAHLQPAAPAPANEHAPSPHPSPPGPARTHEQLAHLLAKAYSDIDGLNRDLAQTRRRAEKAERVAQSLTAVAETSGTNGASQSIPEHITRVIRELEDRLTHAELAREDAEARRRFVMDQWYQVENHLNALDIKVQETRHGFTRVLRDGVPVSLSSGSNLFPLPPHPGPNLRRPRTPSLEGNYPPSKRSRGNDGRGREPRVAYSEANIHGGLDASFARQHGAVRVIQQPGDKYPTNRPRSSSRSSASSIDVDEMLLQASTGDEHPGPNGAVASTAPHGVTISMPLQAQGSQLIQSSHRSRRRHGEIVDPRAPMRMSEAEIHQYHRRPGHIETSPYPASQSVPRKPQEHMQPGAQIQTYQTHIFAPPVTGAPIKKSKYSSMTVSSTNLAPHGSSAVLDAPPQPGNAPAPLVPNFPPVNAQGQRICRQCGQAGRYKEGKCVEKWGPGPAGPGTVCDRCRKKMKRVERRGTLDSQQHLAAAQLAAASAPPPQQHQPHSTADRNLQRSDTLPTHPTASPSSRDKASASAAAPPKVSHVRTIMHPPSVTGKDNRSSPHPHRPISMLDEAPTSNVGRGSRNASRTRDTNTTSATNGHSKSPGESKMVVDGTDSDADAEAEVEGEVESVVGGGRAEEEEEGEEGDAEGDAEAELLEAVDAAEANSNAGSSQTG